MTFGWQGFSLEHPEDWAPVTLTGARKEGYVRIASPHRLSFQVRWKVSKHNIDLSSVLEAYIGRLRQDAKSAKREFRTETEVQDGMLLYRYASSEHGRGAILQSPSCGRVFFLETLSAKNDSLLPTFRKLLEGFRPAVDQDRWAILGLDLKMPGGLEVEKKVLQAGRTQLVLVGKKVRIEAQRWGFAEQLVAKHGLEPWTRSVLNLPGAEGRVSSEGVYLSRAGSFVKAPTYGMAKVQEDRNQITTLKVESREEVWRPTWEWFA